MFKTFFESLKKNELRVGKVAAIYLFFCAIVAVASVVNFAVMGELGATADAGNIDALWRLLGLATLMFFLEGLGIFSRVYYRRRFAARVGYVFRGNFVKYFVRLPFKKLSKTNSGENLSLLQNDVPQAAQFVGMDIFSIFSDIFMVVAAFIFMSTISLAYTAMFFGMFPVLVVMQVLFSAPIQKKSKVRLEKTAEYNATINDSLQNITTVTAYGLEDVMEKRYVGKYEGVIKATMSYAKTLLPLLLFGAVASFMPMFIMTVVTVMAVINGNMTLSHYIAFSGAMMIAAGWLTGITETLQGVQTNRAGAKRYNEATAENLDAQVVYRKGKMGNVTFENVSFTYADDDEEEAINVLDNISFNIPAGSRVAIAGGSGSGKSTVLKLMLGLYQPNSGEITAGGRESFAYVPQDSFLFPESIGQNIACSDEPNMQKLIKVCTDAGIIDFINSLPEKFDTVLTESAENVSGGQKQRIALARAFYHDAPVILFDEATSALDPITEATILETLNEMAQDKTVIMVAHRQSVIDACETVITLEAGKVVSIKGGAA